jgi:hypothetical protein
MNIVRIGFSTVVFFAWAAAAYAQDGSWLVSGFVGAGAASARSHEPSGMAGLAIEFQGLRWAPRASAELLRIGRSCRDSLPPQCGVDTPGGELFLLGAGYDVVQSVSMQVLIRPEVGVARWVDNSEVQRDTYAAAGVAGEARFPIATGAFSVGVRILTSDPVVVTVAWAGIGIRF